MSFFAAELATAGVAVARFEFAYMHRRRTEGKKSGPDPAPVLLERWRQVIAAIDAGGVSRRALFIGGKSMGGRIASMVADDEGVAGLLCLGYPFHPAGKPKATRVAHLQSLATPALFVQGTRDTLGSAEDVADYALSPAVRMHWLADGDHNFKPRRASGRSESQNRQEAVVAAIAFVREVEKTSRRL